ncbi:hypothetical protein ABHC39_05235 [Pediococcus acidilactici]|uniref:hypothetical protein n=1 Tax=Pediococcus acidilactici TaxID=1254 RepID=UPI0023302F57|nr:hypothetical protein [Pediococcus acidilactici]MDB8867664.1 hypothetical protein [Pediococcus acidilactici]
MENVYVVKLGKLYVYTRRQTEKNCVYEMTDRFDEARCLNIDRAKEVAEQIGGKVYKVNLEEVKA